MCNYCYMKGFLQDLSTLAARVQTDVLLFPHSESPKYGTSFLFPCASKCPSYSRQLLLKSLCLLSFPSLTTPTES